MVTFCGHGAGWFRSEGPQPHLIDLAFPRKVMVSVSPIRPGPNIQFKTQTLFSDTYLSLWKPVFSHTKSVHIQLDHPHDDSYTPSIISIQAGTGVHDLQEVRSDLERPIISSLVDT